MARPKANTNERTALERIEDTFWQLLSEKNYEKITISELSKKAKVNHNLIYYYFDNIDDMAIQFFEKNMSQDVSQRIIGVLMGTEAEDITVFNDMEIIKRVKRTRLFMRKDSAFLNGIAKSRIQAEWFKAAGIKKEQLSVEDSVDLEFIFSGIIAIVGSDEFEENIDAIATLHQRCLGQGILGTFKNFCYKER